MASTDGPLLLTLGYGKRSIEEIIAALARHDVRYLVDVRSKPYSRYRPEFSHDALRERVQADGIAYLFLGDSLGGQPDEAGCYDAEGRVDYVACRERPAFRQGVERLRNAWSQGRRVALLCAEARPEECHRSKLVGEALVEAGLEVHHLDQDDAMITQQEVMARVVEGQPGLFADLPPVKAARSRGKYRTDEV